MNSPSRPANGESFDRLTAGSEDTDPLPVTANSLPPDHDAAVPPQHRTGGFLWETSHGG